MSKNEFSGWLYSKFLDWQTREGDRKTLAEFADYLNVSQSTLSMWLNRKRTPTDVVTVQELASLLGHDIYNVIGKPRNNDHLLQYIIANWDKLTPDEIQKISELFGESGVGRNAVENLRKSSHG